MSFILALGVILSLISLNVFAVSVITENGSGRYAVVNFPRLVWAKEENMYQGGAQTVFRLCLKFVKNGRNCCFVYDRLLSFSPHDKENLLLTIVSIDRLSHFIIDGIPEIVGDFQLDSIDIFCANRNECDYKLDIVDVVASPRKGIFPELPTVTFKQRCFSLSTYVSGR